MKKIGITLSLTFVLEYIIYWPYKYNDRRLWADFLSNINFLFIWQCNIYTDRQNFKPEIRLCSHEAFLYAKFKSESSDFAEHSIYFQTSVVKQYPGPRILKEFSEYSTFYVVFLTSVDMFLSD